MYKLLVFDRNTWNQITVPTNDYYLVGIVIWKHILVNKLLGGYHTITDVYTTALLLTNPSSDDDSRFRHGFGAEASLPLTQNAPAVSYDTTRLCQIVVALWDCQIHADVVRALSWIFSMYFLLFNGRSQRLVKKTEVELAIKPLHLTSIGNTFVIQPFLTHCSRRSSYFSNLCWCAQSKFSS